MPGQSKTLENLFHDMLKDIYYAEKKIFKSLPKMAKGAQSEKLAAAFTKHRSETEIQVQRLEQVFEILGKKPQAKKCPAIDGILEEGQEILEEYKDSDALDAGLIAAAQAVEHYEMTRYGTLKRWATVLGLKDAAKYWIRRCPKKPKRMVTSTKLADAQANNKALKEAA